MSESEGQCFLVTVRVFDRAFRATERSFRVRARDAADAAKAAQQRARETYLNVVFANAIRCEVIR